MGGGLEHVVQRARVVPEGVSVLLIFGLVFDGDGIMAAGGAGERGGASHLARRQRCLSVAWSSGFSGVDDRRMVALSSIVLASMADLTRSMRQYLL